MASDFKLFKKKDDKKNNGQNFSLSDKSKFAIVESYKAARTNIMFSLSAKEKKCFAVTSYSKGEGKSTVSANLAISFSKMEKRVLLIDCDLQHLLDSVKLADSTVLGLIEVGCTYDSKRRKKGYYYYQYY